MFNFLASQHRELPVMVGPFDEEEDEFPLKSSRLGDYLLWHFLDLNVNPLHSNRNSKDGNLAAAMSMLTPPFPCLTPTGEPPAVSFPWR